MVGPALLWRNNPLSMMFLGLPTSWPLLRIVVTGFQLYTGLANAA